MDHAFWQHPNLKLQGLVSIYLMVEHLMGGLENALYGEGMKHPKEAKSLVQELDDLLMHSERIHKEVLALAKENRNLKKLKSDLKRALEIKK